MDIRIFYCPCQTNCIKVLRLAFIAMHYVHTCTFRPAKSCNSKKFKKFLKSKLPNQPKPLQTSNSSSGKRGHRKILIERTLVLPIILLLKVVSLNFCKRFGGSPLVCQGIFPLSFPKGKLGLWSFGN